MPKSEFKTKIRDLPLEQVKELAQYAIENEIADFDKAEIIKKMIGTDIISSIQLKKADEEKIEEK